MLHFISSNYGGRYTEGSDFKHRRHTYFLLLVVKSSQRNRSVSSGANRTKEYFSGYFCILSMTEENPMTETKNLQCLLLICKLPNCLLSCLTIPELLSFFLELNQGCLEFYDFGGFNNLRFSSESIRKSAQLNLQQCRRESTFK